MRDGILEITADGRGFRNGKNKVQNNSVSRDVKCRENGPAFLMHVLTVVVNYQS